MWKVGCVARVRRLRGCTLELSGVPVLGCPPFFEAGNRYRVVGRSRARAAVEGPPRWISGFV